VVVDCTPAGNENEGEATTITSRAPRGFIAQGSEFGFGKPYARGVNDEALVPGEDRFIQIVSCNTHNITTLIKTLCPSPAAATPRTRHLRLHAARQRHHADQGLRPAPQVGKHDDPEFGTHHARDAYHVFETLGVTSTSSRARSSSTPSTCTRSGSASCSTATPRRGDGERLRGQPAGGGDRQAQRNEIFSFGRDHGYYGRILSQTVVVLPTLLVRRNRELYGFCFTPQDGNSLLSSVAAALWLIDPTRASVSQRLEPIRRWVYAEI
jgi:hypothetical protein